MKYLNHPPLLALFFVWTFQGLSGCVSSEKINSNSAEGAFKLAEQYEKDERYEESLGYYADVKNKFPYSRHAVKAELRIADIHFKREDFLQSENAYRLFKEFHPHYSRIDYVTFRLGLSYFKQLPSTIDRDLSVAHKAILYFDEVISSYRKSPFVTKAKEHKSESLKMLAEKEMYIAHFYFIREMYHSALGRYEGLIKAYPRLGFDKRALYGAAVSAYRKKDASKARLYFRKLASFYPKANETQKAKKELSRGL